MKKNSSSWFARFALVSVVFLAVAIWMTHSGLWQKFSVATGIGNPDSVVSAPEIPMPGGSKPGEPKADLPTIDQVSNFVEDILSRIPPNGKKNTGSNKNVDGQYTDVLTVAKEITVKPVLSLDGYDRSGGFGNGWGKQEGGCDTRNVVLQRDLKKVTFTDQKKCLVQSGTLTDPYSGRTIEFTRGAGTSSAVQIDHIVPLAYAWRTGAQDLTLEERTAFANDLDNLVAVDGPTNASKGAKSLEEWLPPNEDSWCDYAASWTNVKDEYGLWMSQQEQKQAVSILSDCAKG